MRILVCGGRDFCNKRLMYEVLDYELADFSAEEVTIISGMARGADIMAARYGYENGHNVEEYPADWDKYGRAAGPIRNIQMLDFGKPDRVIAFPGGHGTAHMKRIAKKAGVKVVDIG